MYKLLILSVLLGVACAQVQLHKQCGGKGYTGPTNCVSGSYCKTINEWWFQCEPGNVGSSNNNQAQSTNNNQASSSNSKPGSTGTVSSGKFRHFIAFDGALGDDTYKQYDGISIWLNTIDDKKSTDFNPWYQGDMIKKAKALGKIPVFYAYVIAFEARAKIGLQDCDVDPNYNLCHKGAKFIRENRAHLVSRYAHQSAKIAEALGNKNAEVIFLMEPDFWQFHGDKTQEGGVLDGPYMRKLLDDFVAAIKANLPNAKISFDISAWIGVNGMKEWWSHFASAKYIDFVNTSGGQAHGHLDSIKPNELKWDEVHKIMGRKIIADCGYGVAGGSSDNCKHWTQQNKRSRHTNGVIALSAGVGAKQNPPSLAQP